MKSQIIIGLIILFLTPVLVFAVAKHHKPNLKTEQQVWSPEFPKSETKPNEPLPVPEKPEYKPGKEPEYKPGKPGHRPEYRPGRRHIFFGRFRN